MIYEIFLLHYPEDKIVNEIKDPIDQKVFKAEELNSRKQIYYLDEI